MPNIDFRIVKATPIFSALKTTQRQLTINNVNTRDNQLLHRALCSKSTPNFFLRYAKGGLSLSKGHVVLPK